MKGQANSLPICQDVLVFCPSLQLNRVVVEGGGEKNDHFIGVDKKWDKNTIVSFLRLFLRTKAKEMTFVGIMCWVVLADQIRSMRKSNNNNNNNNNSHNNNNMNSDINNNMINNKTRRRAAACTTLTTATATTTSSLTTTTTTRHTRKSNRKMNILFVRPASIEWRICFKLYHVYQRQA